MDSEKDTSSKPENDIEIINQISYEIDLIRHQGKYYILKFFETEEEREYEKNILTKIGDVDWTTNFVGYTDPLYLVLTAPSQSEDVTNLSKFIFETNNLMDWEEDDDRMNFELEIGIITQLLNGLEQLHKWNITHCSIDLNSILIGDNHAVFTNFKNALANKLIINVENGLIAPEIVKLKTGGFGNGDLIDPLDFYKKVDIFCMGIVMLTILNKSYLFTELLIDYGDDLESYISSLSKLYSNQNWYTKFLKPEWEENDYSYSKIRNKILMAREFLRGYISKMLDPNPKRRIDLKTVIDNVKTTYDSVKNYITYLSSKRIKQTKKSITKIENLKKKYNVYKQMLIKLKNKISVTPNRMSIINKFEEEELKVQKGIKRPSKLRIVQTGEDQGVKQSDTQDIIDDFRKIMLLRKELISGYNDEYNKAIRDLNALMKIKEITPKNELYKTNMESTKNEIKQILETIEKLYLDMKSQMQTYLDFVDIPLDNVLSNKSNSQVGGSNKSKLQKLKRVLNGGGIKRINQYFYDDNEISSGGYGKVYMGWDQDNKIYIIKRLKDTPYSINEILNLREIRQRNNNNCFNNILCYHDHVRDDGYIYIITEYIEDVVDMFDFLTSKMSSLTILQRLLIMINLTKGLDILHKLGIAHSDLKPENVLINPDNLEIQIIDFGGSCNVNRFEMCGVTGTVDFASPEFLNAMLSKQRNLGSMEKYIAGDIFSLGLMFYSLVNNNRLPIDVVKTEDPEQRLKELMKVYSDGIISNSGYSELDKLINNMTQYDYKKRPTLEYIIENLEKILYFSKII